jgi:hypothetical protein
MIVSTPTPPPRLPSHLIDVSLASSDRLHRSAARLGLRLRSIEERIRKIQNARLLSGGAFALALLMAAIRPQWQIPVPAAIIFAPFFAYLVVLSRGWSAFHLKLVRLKSFFERQEARSRGRSPALTVIPFKHETFGADLDFFGHLSLWTLLDETLSDEGSLELKSWITGPIASKEKILARQKTVKSLRPDAWFYTRLTLIADRAEFHHSSRQVLDFLARAATPSNFTPRYIGTVVIWLAWILSIIFGDQLLGGAAHVTSGVLFFIFLFANFGLVGKADAIFKSGAGVSHHLDLLFPVFSALEKRTQISLALRELAPSTAKAGPSREAKPLNFAVGLLSASSNPIVHLAINSASPWTATGVFLLERARRRLGASFAICLKELAHLEALFSLVIFDRYQTNVYPTLETDRLSAREIFHPLVNREKVVANDFAFGSEKSLGLLTGSNMSGKSTFLRTIGVNQALANIGAPVFASAFATRPLTIESCIEVSDSLRDGFSYFYAEVRRLKSLLDSASKGSVLYLIDEIFRGTNNRERQIGSRAVIQALARDSSSEGFISTHDLELTVLESTEPAVVNLHFREEINNGQMSFTYLLQRGASPTTNALRIMQLEGLPVDGLNLET